MNTVHMSTPTGKSHILPPSERLSSRNWRVLIWVGWGIEFQRKRGTGVLQWWDQDWGCRKERRNGELMGTGLRESLMFAVFLLTVGLSLAKQDRKQTFRLQRVRSLQYRSDVIRMIHIYKSIIILLWEPDWHCARRMCKYRQINRECVEAWNSFVIVRRSEKLSGHRSPWTK